MMDTSPDYKVAIIGYGWVGKAYQKMFPDAIIYDEPLIKEKFRETADIEIPVRKGEVNACDMAIISVPTNLKNNGELDMSIVEEVVDWIDTPLILIKSALQPGTVDRLIEKTDKNIAVSVEMVGEGKYYVPNHKYPDAEDPTKHDFLIVGGEEQVARRCADFFWRKMSPDINIHIVSAIEAEICKLMENTWGAQKVTFANIMYDICQDLGADYTKVLQAWGADGRTEKMHMRVLPDRRGWRSKCYDKDVPALAALDNSGWLKKLIQVNEDHLDENNC